MAANSNRVNPVRGRSRIATESSNVGLAPFEKSRLGRLKPSAFSGRRSQTGFIALMSAIIISAILLVVTVTLSYSAFFVRYDILESEYKERSLALAEGCVDTALLKLASNPSYSGNEVITIGSDIDDKCTIRAINPSGANKIVETQAKFRNAFTDLRVIIDPATLALVSWEELPNF